MAATISTDWNFQPKVWQDHINAYFDRKLVWGAFALQDDTLMQSPGETVNFPYYEKIGAAEEPAEAASLTVDNLSDDSFSATVKEVGKAVGAKDKSLVVSADRREGIFGQAQMQMGRVMAEKVDADLLAEINTGGNFTTGYTATTAAEVLTVKRLNQMRVTAFGDRSAESVAVFMHSLHELSLLNDSDAGFLKADANDPMWGVPGFRGRLLGMAVIVVDTVPNNGAVQIGGKDAYQCFIIKNNAYGFINKADLNPEQDRDILAREWVWSATMWYGVKAFHQKVSTDDQRIARGTFTVL
jgi:N4-gp56 family major capsid protein